jgi:DTW domain-containing protein YfiP
LPNSRVFERGNEGSGANDFILDPERQPLLLFPDAMARPLTDFVNSSKPITLIVPDGTWRQASKVRHRLAGIASIPLVGLPPGPPTQYRLRHESHEGGLATMEAIARALGVLDGPRCKLNSNECFGL